MCRIRLELEERPRCPQCGAEIPFEGGYKTFCSKSCQAKYNVLFKIIRVSKV